MNMKGDKKGEDEMGGGGKTDKEDHRSDHISMPIYNSIS